MTDAPKRFYKSAISAELESGWTVTLDGRGVKTPARNDLLLPTQALADIIAEEWAGQDAVLDIAGMHLTRLANVAIDRTPVTRAALCDEVVRYCETDLLCHLAEGSSELREAEEVRWSPVRAWAGQALGVVLIPVEGISPAQQPPASLEAARRYAEAMDDYRLTGLAFACGVFGSALLAMAVEHGHLSAADAFAASRADEDFQSQQWGEDSDAAEAAAAHLLEAYALGAWFEAL